MNIYLTSDTHFGHLNIIQYCARPFNSVEHMDAMLERNWRSVVTDDDVVLHMGDVTLINKITSVDHPRYGKTLSILKNLPGIKILVRGNHDHQKMLPFYKEHNWVVLDKLVVDDTLFIHNPHGIVLDDNVKHVVHGHTHNTWKCNGFTDVGVDAQPNYTPILARSIIGDEKTRSLLLMISKMFCKQVIENTFIACGEGENYCSELCMQRKNH